MSNNLALSVSEKNIDQYEVSTRGRGVERERSGFFANNVQSESLPHTPMYYTSYGDGYEVKDLQEK